LKRLLFVAFLSFVASAPYARATPICALTDAEFATALRTLKSWTAIDQFHSKHFPPCPDDGMYAEGYSDLIVRTLALRWNRVPELSARAKARPEFLAFVLKHIDASADPAQLRQVHRSAKQQCPAGHIELCAALRKSAQEALAELR
jgi:hypothetical protein